MINGTVIDLEAWVKVVFVIPGRPETVLDFVIDTGFAGALTLPEHMVKTLGLVFEQDLVTTLADNRPAKADVYAANIVWQDDEIEVAVLAIGERPLLGTALLAGNELRVLFVENGPVAILQP